MPKHRVRAVLLVVALFALLVPFNASVDASGQSDSVKSAATQGEANHDEAAPSGAPPGEAAQWRTVHNQNFEGTFPPAGWQIYDASHTGGVGAWGKDTDGFNSANAAHPSPPTAVYPNNTHTWMRYGPFSLGGAGVTNARMLFKYWMDTESGYDMFEYAYSCNGTEEWTGRMVSGNGPGPVPAWATATQSLRACIGRTKVYVQFTFHSDLSVNYEGVFVDNVQIQKFS